MSDNFEATKLPPDLVAAYVLHAMLAANSYHQSHRISFDLSRLGWHSETVEGEKGLQYDICSHEETNRTIWAFRGGDEKIDWGKANLGVLPKGPYKEAERAFEDWLDDNGPNNLEVCGHSLGGGLALSMSVKFGISAVALSPSSRIFDGLGDKHRPAARVAIFEDGDPLFKLSEFWPKFKEVVPEDSYFYTSYDFNGSQHRGDALAKCMLDQVLTNDSSSEFRNVIVKNPG